MTVLDRFLRSWRMRVASRWVPEGATLLDIGCFDAKLLRQLSGRIMDGLGLDPSLETSLVGPNWEVRRGIIPGEALPGEHFDCITALAVLEHIPRSELEAFASECGRVLRPGGRLILTVPEPAVDRILEILVRLRVVDGMSLEEHHGFDTTITRALFEKFGGMKLSSHSKFQFGLNNLFIFHRRSSTSN